MKSKRIIAMILCAMMLFAMLPAAVFADEAEEEIVEMFFGEEEEETLPAEEPAQEEAIPEEEEIIPEETGDELLPEEDEIPEDEDISEDEDIPEQPETDEENEFDAEFIAMGTDGSDNTWYIMQDGGLTISGQGEMTDFYMTYTPWYEYRDQITSVKITGVSSVGIRTFVGLSKLTKVTIGNSVVDIKDSAFAECGGITEITFPSSVKRIASAAFWGCSGLSKITFKGDAPTISTNAFYNVNGKAYYNTLASGWDGKLNNYGAAYLSWIAYTEDIEGSCGSLANWSYDGSRLTITGSGAMTNYTADNVPWKNYRSSIESVEIKGALTSIGDFAFHRCSKLARVSFSGSWDSITSIGKYAFSSCTSLQFIDLPASLVSIGDSAFMACSSLNEVWPLTEREECGNDDAAFFELLNNCNITSIASYAFANTAIPYAGIPAKATLGYYNPFMNCKSLSWFTAPQGANYKTADNVLYTADGKKLVAYPCGKTDAAFTVPEGVTSIGDMSMQMAKFSSIKLPQTLTYIGYSAFSDCTNLSSVTVPKLVNYISPMAFAGSAVNEIRFEGKKPTIDSSAFKNITATAFYPQGDSSWDGIDGNNYGGTITWKAYSVHPVPVMQIPANHENYMIIQWSKCEGATGYRLQYREGSGAWTEVNVALTQVNSKGEPRWDYRGAKDGATYTFRVFADFADGTSTESNRVGQMRLRTPKITVKHFGGSDTTGGFRVDWEATTGGSQYKIYYREKGGSWALYTMIPKSYNVLFTNIKASITNANPALPNLVAGHTYEFMVLTCTSVASVTSGYPTPFVSMKF